MHLSRLIFNLCDCRHCNTFSNVCKCLSWLSVCTRTSSMYTMTLSTGLNTCSMSRWNEAGHPNRPIGDVTHSNCPLPGIVNAVRCLAFSSNGICQNPLVRSRVEKIVEFALPMSPMHSWISFMLYLSMCVWLFNSLKSCTIRRPWPCFFGTQKIGEL